MCARHALGANGGEGWAERIPGRNMPVAATFDVRFPWMCYYYRDENFNFFRLRLLEAFLNKFNYKC